MDNYHAEHPDQPNVGTRTGQHRQHARHLRERQGARLRQRLRRECAALGDDRGTWWSYFADRPWLSGGFVWTGFDYRGEPTPYGWPCINSHFGILDTCGFPKDNFYYYQSWWTTNTVLHLLPHWNWPGKEGQEIRRGRLEQLQGGGIVLERRKSLGKQTMKPNSQLDVEGEICAGNFERERL